MPETEDFCFEINGLLAISTSSKAWNSGLSTALDHLHEDIPQKRSKLMASPADLVTTRTTYKPETHNTPNSSTWLESEEPDLSARPHVRNIRDHPSGCASDPNLTSE